MNQLCTLGPVARERGRVPGDARAVSLFATDEGRAVAAHITGAVHDNRDALIDLFNRIAAVADTASRDIADAAPPGSR